MMNSKTLVFLLISGLFIFSDCLNHNPNNAELFFPKKDVHFDSVIYKSEISQKFLYYNISNHSLYIKTIISTCGCTKPIWSDKGITPGKSGEILIKVITDRLGPFKQSVVVYYNGQNSPDTLSIEGFIYYPVSVK